MTATVIIPTTGAPPVHEAIKSVLNQTYDTKCYIVCDGPEYVYAVKKFTCHNLTRHERIINLNLELKGMRNPRLPCY